MSGKTLRNTGYIYQIVNDLCDKVYVGSSVDYNRRFVKHVKVFLDTISNQNQTMLKKRKSTSANNIFFEDYEGSRMEVIEIVDLSDIVKLDVPDDIKKTKYNERLFGRECYYVYRMKNTVNIMSPIKNYECPCKYTKGYGEDCGLVKHIMSNQHQDYLHNSCLNGKIHVIACITVSNLKLKGKICESEKTKLLLNTLIKSTSVEIQKKKEEEDKIKTELNEKIKLEQEIKMKLLEDEEKLRIEEEKIRIEEDKKEERRRKASELIGNIDRLNREIQINTRLQKQYEIKLNYNNVIFDKNTEKTEIIKEKHLEVYNIKIKIRDLRDELEKTNDELIILRDPTYKKKVCECLIIEDSDDDT